MQAYWIFCKTNRLGSKWTLNRKSMMAMADTTAKTATTIARRAVKTIRCTKSEINRRRNNYLISGTTTTTMLDAYRLSAVHCSVIGGCDGFHRHFSFLHSNFTIFAEIPNVQCVLFFQYSLDLPLSVCIRIENSMFWNLTSACDLHTFYHNKFEFLRNIITSKYLASSVRLVIIISIWIKGNKLFLLSTLCPPFSCIREHWTR